MGIEVFNGRKPRTKPKNKFTLQGPTLKSDREDPPGRKVDRERPQSVAGGKTDRQPTRTATAAKKPSTGYPNPGKHNATHAKTHTIKPTAAGSDPNAAWRRAHLTGMGDHWDPINKRVKTSRR